MFETRMQVGDLLAHVNDHQRVRIENHYGKIIDENGASCLWAWYRKCTNGPLFYQIWDIKVTDDVLIIKALEGK